MTHQDKSPDQPTALPADKHLYEVRYPDGSTVRLRAHRMQIDDHSVCLFGRWGTSPGNVIFVAGLASGVTITQPEHTVPES